MSLLAILFWLCISGVIYIYAGYPIMIGFFARFFSKPVRKSSNTFSASIVISIYNEAPRLAAKLKNILSSEGSSRIVQILIGSDGSNDEPERIIREVDDPRIQLIPYSTRRGKPSILNDLIPKATGDIVIMMDVRQRLDHHALTSLLDNFSDPSVGVVSGELVFERSETDSSAAGGIDAYWRYEKWIREREGRFQSVPGATGALYAVRRELVSPIPAGAALDDVLIPMQAIQCNEFRCVLDPAAVMFDRPAQNTAQESIRKQRTLAGCVQLLRYHPEWCLPGGHPIWWQFISHKIARLISPFLMLGALVFSALLAPIHPAYGWLLTGQVLFYVLGVWGLIRKEVAPKSFVYFLPRMIGIFISMQGAIVMGWGKGIRHSNLALWHKAG